MCKSFAYFAPKSNWTAAINWSWSIFDNDLSGIHFLANKNNTMHLSKKKTTLCSFVHVCLRTTLKCKIYIRILGWHVRGLPCYLIVNNITGVKVQPIIHGAELSHVNIIYSHGLRFYRKMSRQCGGIQFTQKKMPGIVLNNPTYLLKCPCLANVRFC